MDKHHPYLGFGLGLRTDHFQHVLEHRPELDWFEVLSENYMVDGGKPLYFLDAIREHYPVVMHGVSMSIGCTDPLNFEYLKQLKILADRIQPKWLSDHLCWTGVNHINSHDLLPLPYNEEALNHLVERIKTVQDYLELPFLVENVSSYLTYNNSEMSEWEFLNEVSRLSGCNILLDINNIYVNSINHKYDAEKFLKALPGDRIAYAHIAGHYVEAEDLRVDTHGADVIDPVWKLLDVAYEHFGVFPTLLERDFNIPPMETLLKEVDTIRYYQQKHQTDDDNIKQQQR